MFAGARMRDLTHDAGPDAGIEDGDDAVQRKIETDQAELLGAGQAK